MPRNPYKASCQASDCRNGAMRGQSNCRVHRKPELGSAGGAPLGNLNALRTGEHVHPLSYTGLQILDRELASQPDQLPDLLEGAVQSIYSRSGDSSKTLPALVTPLEELLPLVSEDLCQAELEALLRQ